MARERVISGHQQERDDDRVGNVLRPTRLTEMVGQSQVMEQLHIAMTAAKKRDEALEHILLDGPPGLGKTTLAHVIANEMNNRAPKVSSGAVLNKNADLMSLLTNLEEREVLFIDEIHRLPRHIEEFLYPAMEDYRVDYAMDGGVGGRVISFALRRFTLIGATTRAGMLSAAMRDRFGIHFHLEFYSDSELSAILQRSARKLKIPASEEALEAIAARSRGTPRVSNRLLRRVRDFAQVNGDGILNLDVVQDALEVQRIDRLGLDDLDRNFLNTLINVYRGGPAGIEAIAATMGQERDTLEDVVEPFLLQLGFVIRTRQGRQATRLAYEHMKLPCPNQNNPNDQNTLF